MSKAKKSEKNELSFEEELEQLEAIVESLEGGDVPLAQLVERYEAGMKHLKNCQAKLADAELRIEQLRGVSPDGEAQADAFEDTASEA